MNLLLEVDCILAVFARFLQVCCESVHLFCQLYKVWNLGGILQFQLQVYPSFFKADVGLLTSKVGKYKSHCSLVYVLIGRISVIVY
jgi:hypothetical protein